MLDLFGPNEVQKFNDLQGKKLSKEARLHLCEEINGCHSISGPLTVCGATKRYNLSRNSVKSWYEKFRSGGCFYDGKGRPSSPDSEAKEALKRKLGDMTSPTSPSEITDEVAYLIEQGRIETRIRNRKGIVSYPVSIDILSDETMRRIKQKLVNE